ncbi:MAG: hypothetical protein U0L26_09495 [Cellulosilyticum sp.]|nr:hypothetical protein [Cellulosilyticum sp.]
MSRWSLIGGVVIVILISGCGNKGIYIEETNTVGEALVEEAVEVEQEEDTLSGQNFKAFFKDYFSFSDEEILLVNQVRNHIDQNYWKHLKQNYTPLIKKKLGKYLSANLNQKLEKQFVHSEIYLPKWVQINDYAVSGQAQIENITIKSIKDLGESMAYEIVVETKSKCYPLPFFNNQYEWSDEVGYWTKKVSSEEKNIEIESEITNHYLFSKLNNDEIKLEQSFVIITEKGKDLKIKQINQSEAWKVASEKQQQSLDTQYINRIPYRKKVWHDEAVMIQKVFNTLITFNQDDINYYNSAYDEDALAFEKMWADVGLGDIITIDKKHYKAAFSKAIIPNKDEVITLRRTNEEIVCSPSVYSTKNQPRFIVTIPVETLLNNNEIVYYNYKYFVGLEDGRVEFIQFLDMEKCIDEQKEEMNESEEYVEAEGFTN